MPGNGRMVVAPLVEPGRNECIYSNMPAFGLGAATTLTKAERRLAAAKQRFAA